MRISLILLLVVLMMAGTATAQRRDSLACGYDHVCSWQQTLSPTLLIASGSAIAFSPLHERWDMPLRDWAQADGHARWEVENAVQYVPGATVLLLKACGLESQHGWRDMLCLGAGASLTALAINHTMKYCIAQERPYPWIYNSFPSGHTVTAFTGAEILRREYGEEYPAVAVAGYAVAAGVGAMRIYNNRHWASDVLAGAGVGILSASIAYWLAPYLRF